MTKTHKCSICKDKGTVYDYAEGEYATRTCPVCLGNDIVDVELQKQKEKFYIRKHGNQQHQ